MSFHAIEKYRLSKKQHPILGSDSYFGNNGAFKIPLEDDLEAFVIISDGKFWEHVSVHVVQGKETLTPTWDEMCLIKDLFWDKEDCVIQYHPPESKYVNNHPNVLHLWRPTNKEIPIPETILIGIKK